MRGILRDLAGYVTSVADGSEAVIISSGFEVRMRTDRIGKLPAPGDLVARLTDFHGGVDTVWKPVYGAYLYQVHMNSSEPLDESKWEMVGATTKIRHLVTGLETGRFHHFRVQAIGAAGPSPMSDIARSLAA